MDRKEILKWAGMILGIIVMIPITPQIIKFIRKVIYDSDPNNKGTTTNPPPKKNPNQKMGGDDINFNPSNLANQLEICMQGWGTNHVILNHVLDPKRSKWQIFEINKAFDVRNYDGVFSGTEPLNLTGWLNGDLSGALLQAKLKLLSEAGC